jgi:hypothetical protein
MFQSPEHKEADADHKVESDGYNCTVCGLAATADGQHHGFDDPYDFCPETWDGRHQVTDGSCNMCGAKNFN